jgi:ubiquinone/menaquinone biosynthesis C-methylase UbiE
LDRLKADAFAGKLLEAFNQGALALMVSLGHRTGLFDTMNRLATPATSEEIAGQAGLSERYVREWLGAMVVSRVVEYKPEQGTYRLPAEHAAYLTRAAGADNLAALAQYIPQLGYVEDKIVECFEKGGGVPYSEYPRFQQVMADDSGQSVLPVLIDGILPLVPELTERLEQGIDVLDVGCGSGKALILLARHFPKSRFTGYDILEEGLSSGRAEAESHGLKNVKFVKQDAAAIPDREAFDLITTFDAVHDQAKPMQVLRNIHRALRSDGVYFMQDIDLHTHVEGNLEHPLGTLLYTVSCMHCMTVSLAYGGAGLGATWGVELAQQMLREAGFRSTRIERLPHDIQNCYFINQK